MDIISEWEGITVIGDSKELDTIIGTPTSIALHKSDLLRIMESGDCNYIITGDGPTISAAMGNATAKALFDTGKASRIAVALWCGAAEFRMKTMGTINDELSIFGKASEIIWGIFDDPTLRNWFKITILASIRQ